MDERFGSFRKIKKDRFLKTNDINCLNELEKKLLDDRIFQKILTKIIVFYRTNDFWNTIL